MFGIWRFDTPFEILLTLNYHTFFWMRCPNYLIVLLVSRTKRKPVTHR